VDYIYTANRRRPDYLPLEADTDPWPCEFIARADIRTELKSLCFREMFHYTNFTPQELYYDPIRLLGDNWRLLINTAANYTPDQFLVFGYDSVTGMRKRDEQASVFS
jgi:hypothetical protein